MMNITKIEKYKGNTYEVEFDDGAKEYLNIDIITDYHLKAPMSLPESAWKQVSYANQLRTAKERALYLLDYKDYSYTELFKKLEQNYPTQVCFDTMARLVEIGVINDKRYAVNMARRLAEVKGFGYYRCVREMRLKGLDNEFIEEALAPYRENTVERLKELVEEKYAHKIRDKKSLDKVKNALVRLGYSFSQVKEALEDYTFEDDDDQYT